MTSEQYSFFEYCLSTQWYVQNLHIPPCLIYYRQPLAVDLSAYADHASTRKDFFLVRSEGGRQVSRTVSHYNLEDIISVGFRVNSVRGAQFRRWATSILKDYLLNGYSVHAHINQLEDKMDRRLAEHDQQIIELKDLGTALFAFHTKKYFIFPLVY